MAKLAFIRSRMIRLIAASALIALASGCASPPPPPTIENLRFIPTPRDISSAWIDQGGDLYMVPEKGVLIDAIESLDGYPLPFKAQGSYVVVPAPHAKRHHQIRALIEGRWRIIGL